MKWYKAFYILLSISLFVRLEGSDRSLNVAESVIVGGLVGAAEVAFPGQLFSYAMNSKIKNTPFVLTDSYKGFAVNALGQMPIVAMQQAVKTKGTQLVEA